MLCVWPFARLLRLRVHVYHNYKLARKLVELRQKPAAKPVMTSYMCERETDGFL